MVLYLETRDIAYKHSVESSIYTKIATELWKRVMCPAWAKAVNVLAVRYVKQGTEAAGFRTGSILYTPVNMLV